MKDHQRCILIERSRFFHFEPRKRETRANSRFLGQEEGRRVHTFQVQKFQLRFLVVAIWERLITRELRK